VVRSDLLQQRLECSQYISAVTSFLEPLQKINEVSSDWDVNDFASLLSKAIGSLSVHQNTSKQDLDDDLRNRLSFPWLSTTPLSPRRLAWVQGREDIDCIERALKAAVALGIKLVILDEPGHWLQDPSSPWAYLREAFIEVDITADEGLPTRVVDAIRAYPKTIDGVVTISDVRLPAIARACRELGLPTENPEAYDIASDKGRTRMLETVGADESFVLSKADELEPYLKSRSEPLGFPLVVKPVVGWCSDCVSKVQNLGELVVAVRKASERHANSANPSTTVVVEPYIDGPEVDANFALLDGEILFFDINDDFPSPADDQGAGFQANFQETQNVVPSGLPQVELDAIRDQIRDSILRQGFKSGVFHCEARVRSSSVKFATKQDSIVDLVAKEGENEKSKLEVYLHENNARPPGYLESVAVLLSYGIDYYALRMLLALGPSEYFRLRALSEPFRKGPQFHLSLMIIQQTRAGIMKTPDAAKEFLEQHAEMKQHVVDFYTRKKGGDVLEGPDASALWWIAYFSVTSRHSRRELLERVDFIQRNFAYEIEEGM
jgi:biotin carboxylase